MAQQGSTAPNRVTLTGAFGVSPGQGVVVMCLGVKGSQVQILSSRQGCQRPADLELIQVSGPFSLSEACRVGDLADIGPGTIWGPVRHRRAWGQLRRVGLRLVSQPAGAENPVTSRYPQVFVDESAEAIPPRASCRLSK
ncbi:MAG: hypothetical protein QOG96_6986 [Pseudonocardiales bacterium]|nr:hypothetical protein [Pseudonocardiales bacterium]